MVVKWKYWSWALKNLLFPFWWIFYISLEFFYSIRAILGYLPTAKGPAALLTHRGRGSLHVITKTGFMERVINQGKQSTLHISRPGEDNCIQWEPSYLGESKCGSAFPANDWTSAVALLIGLCYDQAWSFHLHARLKVSCGPHFYVQLHTWPSS